MLYLERKLRMHFIKQENVSEVPLVLKYVSTLCYYEELSPRLR